MFVLLVDATYDACVAEASFNNCPTHAQYRPLAVLLNQISNEKDAECMHLLQAHGACTESQAAAIIYEVLKVIATCHAEGLLHGDIKPGMSCW